MIQQLESLGRMWAASLMNASVQIAVLVLLVAVASFLLRNSSPVVRYALWCIVLVRLCIPMGFSLPSFERSLTPATHISHSSVSPSRASVPRSRSPQSTVSRSQRRAEFRARVQRERRFMTATGMAWITGSGMIVLIVALRALSLRRRIRALPVVCTPEFDALVHACAADMGLRRSVQVRVAPDDECPAPAVTALFKPIIILPQTMVETWTVEDLKPILIHELAHVRRRDVGMNWLQIVLQTFYFFHPLVWLANWKIRTLREEACDDLSIAVLGGSRHTYSVSLLRAIELANSARPRWGVVALAERKSDLVKRLRRVLRPEYKPAEESRLKVCAKVVVLGSMCLLLSGMVPVQAQQHHKWAKCGARSVTCRDKQMARHSADTQLAAPKSVVE
ncbi:MAG: M56 family metallopeptidase [Candidatus Sumerlaeaceae bacterium]